MIFFLKKKNFFKKKNFKKKKKKKKKKSELKKETIKRREKKLTDRSQVSQGDQTGKLKRVLKNISQHNGARVLQEDLELPDRNLLDREVGSVALDRALITSTAATMLQQSVGLIARD